MSVLDPADQKPEIGSRLDVPVRRIRCQVCRRTREVVPPGQAARRVAGELGEDSSGHCVCRTGSICSCTPICCASPSLMACCPRSRCASSPSSPGVTTAASAISPRARTSNTTGLGFPRCRISWIIWPRSRCTPSRPAAIASATSRPTLRWRCRRRDRDPRVWSEIIRQWSTASGIRLPAAQVQDRPDRRAPDRAAVRLHDIGLRMVKNDAGEVGFESSSAAGRAHARDRRFHPRFPAEAHLLSYLEAILRVYNMLGRRDNIYKARIKIWSTSDGAANSPVWSKRIEERIKAAPQPARIGRGRARPEVFRAAGPYENCRPEKAGT